MEMFPMYQKIFLLEFITFNNLIAINLLLPIQIVHYKITLVYIQNI